MLNLENEIFQQTSTTIDAMGPTSSSIARRFGRQPQSLRIYSYHKQGVRSNCSDDILNAIKVTIISVCKHMQILMSVPLATEDAIQTPCVTIQWEASHAPASLDILVMERLTALVRRLKYKYN